MRLTIALHTKLEEDHRRQSEEGAAERERRADEAREKRRAYQLARASRAVEATLDAAAGKNWQERDRTEKELRERLLDFDDYALCGQRSVGEIIARICRDLGVTPDWTRWVDADWARDRINTLGGFPLTYDAGPGTSISRAPSVHSNTVRTRFPG